MANGKSSAPPQNFTPRAKGGTINLDEPCPTCTKPKRILCIRSNRKREYGPQHWGHANLALVEITDKGKQTTTYGNWPSEAGPPTANTMEGMPGMDSTHTPQPSTLKKDYKYDKDHADYKYVRCKEIDEDQYKKLQEHTSKADQDWNFYNNNCATWSGEAWKDVTGEGLYYGKYMPATYDAPANLGSSIINANGGTNTNIVGGF